MRLTPLLVALLLAAVASADNCDKLYKKHLSTNFNETIAHAIHSITLNELRKFDPFVDANNGIPVVNPRLNDPSTDIRVVLNAPLEEIGDDFNGETMNIIDMVLSQTGLPTDKYGVNWPPVGKIVHEFHMRDLWQKIRNKFFTMQRTDSGLCECLLDVNENGIYDAVDWAAGQYKQGLTLTLLGKPTEDLTDAHSWEDWKSNLLHYYNSQAVNDAAIYLDCALNQ